MKSPSPRCCRVVLPSAHQDFDFALMPTSLASMLLVINCGSSSNKFGLFELPTHRRLLCGVVELLDTDTPRLVWTQGDEQGSVSLSFRGHESALIHIAKLLNERVPALNLKGIGHRVVHGGEHYSTATRIDCEVIDRIEELIPLAPLHNPAHLQGIRSAKNMFPGIPQFAVFDTAYHQSMPPSSFRYAIPDRFYSDHKVRRYGAHGTSHQFIATRAAEVLGKPLKELQLITAHLGNGCSACAIKSGESVDTTMGLTPQEGMMMGTRSGDVDPTLHNYIATATGASLDSISTLLTKESGLLGVSGTTNDIRELEKSMNRGDSKAKLALELFCYRAAKSILGIAASLSRLDALVFTAGIGENSAFVRKHICNHLSVVGIELNEKTNQANGGASNGIISQSEHPKVLVVKTDEELAIAQQVAALLQRA